MSKPNSFEECVEQMHEVAIAMGRLAPLRDPIANAAGEAIAIEMSAGQLHVLMRLGYDGPLHMGLLATRIGISLPACTRLVDRMKDEGMVLRERDTDDRRVVLVRLAAAGRRYFEQIDASVLLKLSGLLSLLESNERNQFVAILQKLHDGIAEKMAESLATAERTS